MAVNANLKINQDRLWDSLMEMAKIGPGVRGGNNRQALTDEDGEGRRLFAQWCEDAGMTVTVDQMGSMFARRPGMDDSLPPVVMGSHLDTQPTGGKYDGVLGVLAGLEAVRTLNEAGIKTRHPIEIVNWTNEEGTRFAPAMVASGVFAGVYDLDWAYDREDTNGNKLGDELMRIGFAGDVPAKVRPIKAFYELHIEQGPILEAEGVDIGVVTHGQGLVWLKVTLTGKESHAGSTPMPRRHDAGLGMARIIEMANGVALEHAPDAVATIGYASVYPNSVNIIPGRTEFTIDARTPDPEILREMENKLCERAEKIAEDLGITIEIENIGGFDPITFDEDCVSAVRNAAQTLGYSHRDIVSGAGHDACNISSVAPASMIFCPCVDGLSHNEDEEISPRWAAAGADVLLHAALNTAEVGND